MSRPAPRAHRVKAIDTREVDNNDGWAVRANALDNGSFRHWWIRTGTEQAAARLEGRERRRWILSMRREVAADRVRLRFPSQEDRDAHDAAVAAALEAQAKRRAERIERKEKERERRRLVAAENAARLERERIAAAEQRKRDIPVAQALVASRFVYWDEKRNGPVVLTSNADKWWALPRGVRDEANRLVIDEGARRLVARGEVFWGGPNKTQIWCKNASEWNALDVTLREAAYDVLREQRR